MSYLPHQIEKSDELLQVLKDNKIACLWGAPRSGKTRTAIRTVEGFKTPLVLTKKNAIPGWKSELKACGANHIHVTNYEQAHKIIPGEHDVIIIDESHNLNKVGKQTKRFRDIRELAYITPCLFLTGTPAIEKQAGLYYQLGVSQYSPFAQFRSFYDFFRCYGVPETLWIGGRQINQYNKVKPELMEKVLPYVVEMTQADAGISCNATDKVHTVKLGPAVTQWINKIKKDGVVKLDGEEYAFESDMAVRSAIHQSESGAVLLDGGIQMLPCYEVVNYIKTAFGDSPDVALMAHFRSTREKLKQELPKCHIYSSDGHAEGVNLSHYKHFVIVNSGYSGAKFVQRRERIVNINRDTEAVVHHIVTDNGISKDVYNAVSNKKDYNIQLFRHARTTNSKEDT